MLSSAHWVYDAIRYGYKLKSYTLLERIGEGGEADIWSAWDAANERVVAIRIIPIPDVDPDIAAQVSNDVARQVDVLSRIDHPNVLAHYEFGSEKYFHYIVMRYCPAGSLADRILAGPISLTDVLKMTAQITSALDHLHGHNIVHRDLNPSNILLDGHGRTYLSDFGLAKLYAQSTLPMHTGRGTQIYAPFEQFARFEVVPQSDLYSLGITIFEMLTGRLPWSDTGIFVSRPGEHDKQLPDLLEHNLDVPGSLTPALRRMTAYYWDERPSSAREAYELLIDATRSYVDEDLEAYRNLQKLDDETLIQYDAQFLLEKIFAHWNPDTDKFPTNLTHFALIGSACSPQKEHKLEADGRLGRFMLRGALTHNYLVDEWWGRISESQDRTLVCLQIVAVEDDETIGRALSQLLGEEDEVRLPERLRATVLERLVDLITMSMSWSLRQKAIRALRRLLPKADHWQPAGVSISSDVKLANVALDEPALSTEISEFVSWVRSDAAVNEFVESYAGYENQAALDILADIQNSAGSLPGIVPLKLKLRVLLHLARQKWRQDLRRMPLVNVLLGLSAGLVVALMMLVGLFSGTDMRMRDNMFEPYPVSNVVTIVEIGDADLEYYGRWDNWPRKLHAELVDRLSQAGARAILLDYVFAAETDEDPELIEAIKRAGNVIQPVLGLGDAYRGAGEMVYEELLLPNESLLEAVASVGHTNIILNEDGVGRQAPLIIRAGEEQYPSMAIAAIQVFMGVEEGQFGELENGVLEFAGRRIPVDDSSAMIVNYAGPPASPDFTTFQTVSYRSVIDGQAPGELIKDKIVLVGMTATGERDYYMTPVSHGRPMAGVELMANKIETIWSDRFIDRPGEGLRILILMLVGVLIGLLPQRVWTGLALTILIAVLYILVASWLFDSRGVMLDLFYPFLVMTLSYAVTTAYRLAAR